VACWDVPFTREGTALASPAYTQRKENVKNRGGEGTRPTKTGILNSVEKGERAKRRAEPLENMTSQVSLWQRILLHVIYDRV
jgi:hypothetical protein